MTKMIPSNRDNQNALIEGQGFVPGWAQNAGILRPNVMTLLSDTLRDVSAAVVSSEEQIIEIVARNSLRSPVPDRFSQMIQKFVAEFRRGLDPADKGTETFLQRVGIFARPSVCYTVFHHGRDHYYYDELPREVLKLRETTVFWINRALNEFRSNGEPRKEGECPPARALRMLRFLCLERNAGKMIHFSELYSYAWEPVTLPTQKQMCNSINVAENEINNFAAERFISDRSKKDDAKVIRIRGEDIFTINEEAPQECCIVKVIKSPWPSF
jgi:hypothetical protein